MNQTELLMAIYKRLEEAEFRGGDVIASGEAAEDIHAWLIEEIPVAIREELSAEAFDEVGL